MEEHLRSIGSVNEFEDDWTKALCTNDLRYLSYPSINSDQQSNLFEGIKAEQITEMLANSKITSGKALEFGCGAAGISLFLASLGFESHICDLSENALRIAQLNQMTNASAVDFASAIKANAVKLPYAANCFDIVFSNGLLEHFEIDTLHELLDETIRVLKPGGLYIADIIPGPKRMNIRTFGNVFNFLGSFTYHLATGKWRDARKLYKQYFNYYYESAYSEKVWREIFSLHQLSEINIMVCRPFPQLALSGVAEKYYVAMIRKLIPFHRKFDKANNWLTRRWGWMYLIEAHKR